MLHNNSKIQINIFGSSSTGALVDPDRLSNKQTFTQARKGLEARDCITTGDTILLERDVRYGDKERAHLKQKNTNIIMIL